MFSPYGRLWDTRRQAAFALHSSEEPSNSARLVSFASSAIRVSLCVSVVCSSTYPEPEPAGACPRALAAPPQTNNQVNKQTSKSLSPCRARLQRGHVPLRGAGAQRQRPALKCGVNTRAEHFGTCAQQAQHPVRASSSSRLGYRTEKLGQNREGRGTGPSKMASWLSTSHMCTRPLSAQDATMFEDWGWHCSEARRGRTSHGPVIGLTAHGVDGTELHPTRLKERTAPRAGAWRAGRGGECDASDSRARGSRHRGARSRGAP